MDIEASTAKRWGPEPAGSVTVEGRSLHGVEVADEEIANLVDEVPLVAALGALAKGRTTLRDTAGFLRGREGDYLARIAENLSAMGVFARASEGTLTVEGPSKIQPEAALKICGDPRMAMTLAILSIFAEKPVFLGGISCVDGACPGFWNQLSTMGVNVE